MKLQDLFETRAQAPGQYKKATFVGQSPVGAEVDPSRPPIISMMGRRSEKEYKLKPKLTRIFPGDTGYWEREETPKGEGLGPYRKSWNPEGLVHFTHWFVRSYDTARVPIVKLPNGIDDVEIQGYHGSYNTSDPHVYRGKTYHWADTETRNSEVEQEEDPLIARMRKIQAMSQHQQEPESREPESEPEPEEKPKRPTNPFARLM